MSRKMEIFNDVDPELHNAARHAKSLAWLTRTPNAKSPTRNLRGFPRSLLSACIRKCTERRNWSVESPNYSGAARHFSTFLELQDTSK